MLCADSNVILTARDGISYQWSTNATTQSITVSAAGLYFVTITHADGSNIVDTFKVTTVRINSIAGVHIPDICAGDSKIITVGHDATCNLTIVSHETILALNDTVFLPDGRPCGEPPSCSYRSSLIFAGYEDTAHVNSVNDIRYVRLNLEHSWSGDLYINLTCPNGQKADILRMGNTYAHSICANSIPNSSRGWADPTDDNALDWTFFGYANDAWSLDSLFTCDPSHPQNAPGTGWNYCWSNNTSENYGYAPGDGLIYRYDNVIEYDGYEVFDSSNVATGTQFYHPDESFESLVGCPLNGSWYIEVMDGSRVDNGYIFGWELALAPDIQTVEYADVDSTAVEGPWVTATSDSSFVFSPPGTLAHDTTVNYNFRFYSEYGCCFEMIIPITFLAKDFTQMGDTAVCDSIIWHGITYRPPTTLYDTLTNTNGCDSILVYNLISTPPTPANITGPHFLCPDSSVVLTTDSGAAYLWSNGETTQTITVNEPGAYSVTVYHSNGCTSESSDFQIKAPNNPIINAFLTDEMVAGDTLFAVMGVLEGDNLQYAAPQSTLVHNGTVFLPDGVPCGDYGCSYRDTLTFSGFPDTAVITSANEIQYVRLNIEHSDIRDLYINLSCPDGQKSTILKKSYENSDNLGQCNGYIPASDRGWQSGSINAVFGSPYLQSGSPFCDPTIPNNRPGKGWNYCWSNDTLDNYQYAPTNGSLVYQYGNTHPYPTAPFSSFKRVVDSSNVAAGTQFYHPDQSFDSLIGCHLNGYWIIEVMDGMKNDNGYIFSWEISLGERLTMLQQPSVVEANCTGPWITHITDSTFYINPPDTLVSDTVVHYNLTVINEAGCSYDTILYITIYAHKHLDLYDTVFPSELPFTWQDSIFNGPSTKTIHLLTTHGADSIVSLHLSVKYPYDTAVCANTFPLLDWHQQTFTEADTVTVSYPVNGADSIEVLSVSSLPTSLDTISVSFCFEYFWHNSTYYKSGDYSFDTINIHGCDSTVILHLTIFDTNVVHTFDTACEHYTWHGTTYYQSNEYTFDTINVHGCDSTVILHLTIFDTNVVHTFDTACENYTWHGTTYYQSDEYIFDTINMLGCDSTVILHLTIFDTNVVHTFDTACENYTWHGTTYYQSDEYIFDTINMLGCDSTVILHLTIFDTNVVHTFDTACEHYTWHGTTYYQSDKYTFDTINIHGCDSTIILHLTVFDTNVVHVFDTACDHYIWHGSTYYSSDEYTFDTINIHGCDSTIILHLTIYPIPDIHISGPAIFCGDTAILTADSASSYLWNTGDTTRQIVVTEPGLYSVTCMDTNRCQATVTHQLMSAYASPIVSVNMPGICAGTIDTITVGYQASSSIILSSTGDTPDDFDTITKVTHVTMEDLWATPLPDSDSSFALSPPDDLPIDTTVRYNFHFEDDNGCGYDTNFKITFYAHHYFRMDTTVCNAFSWNGTTYTVSDTIRLPEPNSNGCTDTLIIHLTVNYSATSEDTLQLVENDLPYHFTPTDTIFGENSPLEFQFDYIIPTEQECDSLIHQTVIIYPNIHQSFDTTVCSLPINWHGHTFTTARSLTDTLLTNHGSDSLVTLTLHVNDLAASVNGITHVNCYGDSTGTASASVTGGIAPFNYLWSNTSGSSISTTTVADHLPAGVYIFTVTDSLGCTVSDTATVNTLHTEMVPGSITEDQDICEGDELQSFTGTAATGGDNSLYQWQILFTDSTEWDVAPGIHNTQNYTFPQAVTSSFALRRAWISQNCGTRYSDTVMVRFWPTYHDTITDHVCQNEPYTDNGFDLSSDETSDPGLLTREMTYPTVHCDSIIVLQLTINPTYETYFEDEICEGSGYTGHGFNVNAMETIGTETLDKTLTLQSEQGCDSTLRLHLSVIDTSVQIVSFTPDFCEEMSAELSVITEMPDYLWSTGENTMQITVNQPGIYSVTAFDGECSSSSSFIIENCLFQIYLPNTITPSNKDMINDYFCIPEYYLNNINYFEISIFNRWGEQVFYSTDKHFKWYGEVDGKLYPNNIYTYIIHYTANTEKPQLIKGTITVL